MKKGEQTRARWGRVLLYVLGVVVVLLVAVYLCVTTSVGLRMVAVPLAESLLGMSITYEKADFSPTLSRVSVEGLDVSLPDVFSFSAQTLRARVRPWMLLWKTLQIEELTATEARLFYVIEGDENNEAGTGEGGSAQEETGRSSLHFDVRGVGLADVDVLLEWKAEGR